MVKSAQVGEFRMGDLLWKFSLGSYKVHSILLCISRDVINDIRSM